MAEIEFKGGLYTDGKENVVLPPEGIKATIVSGAKKSKDGPKAKSGIFCTEPASLEILDADGPVDPDNLWKTDRYRDRRSVVVGKARIMRTRPIFTKWAATVPVLYDENICNEQEVIDWAATAGREVGAFDNRVNGNGRFSVQKVE